MDDVNDLAMWAVEQHSGIEDALAALRDELQAHGLYERVTEELINTGLLTHIHRARGRVMSRLKRTARPLSALKAADRPEKESYLVSVKLACGKQLGLCTQAQVLAEGNQARGLSLGYSKRSRFLLAIGALAEPSGFIRDHVTPEQADAMFCKVFGKRKKRAKQTVLAAGGI